MHKLTCDQTRRELDEIMLSDQISETAGSHLDQCAACREFHSTHTKLRQLVGSLGTVQAPADFDFKLRARLASGPSTTVFNFWPVAKWSLTAVAAVLLFVGGFSVVRQITGSKGPDQTVVNNNGPAPVTTPAQPGPTISDKGNEKETVAAVDPQKQPQNVIKVPGTRKEKRPQFSVRDISSDQAPVISTTRPGREDIIFRVDATGQPITVSVDDGRGNSRTISVPTVTFGSQRVIGSTSQYAPKGVW